jgi:SEC-C motif-containing protein
MRSRYSAFVYHKGDYLLNTWDESTRPSDIELAFSMKWTQLKIIRCKLGRAKDSEGWVTFKADYQQGEQAGCLHEKSYFRRDEHNRWRYVDGRIFSD